MRSERGSKSRFSVWASKAKRGPTRQGLGQLLEAAGPSLTGSLIPTSMISSISPRTLSETAPFRLQEGVELGASLLFVHTLIVDKSVALSHACQGTGYL